LEKSGLATSYLAYDPLFERKVVVKVFADHATDDITFCSRLEQQSQVALTLLHSSFVPLYEVVKDEGELHVVMHYMEGASLAERLQDEGPLSLQQARDLLAHLAEGLAYLHQQGAVHGNIKANNVLFDEAGEVYLADFGMFEVITEEEEEEEQEDRLVSAYQPPEAKAGEPLDAYADIYQLGVFLFEMLTGHLPPTDEDEAPALSRYRADLPASCAQVIARALKPQKTARYATVNDLLTAFDAAIAQPTRPCLSKKGSIPAFLPLFNRQCFANLIPWLSFIALLSINTPPAKAIKAEYHLPTPQPLRMGLFLSSVLALLMFLMRVVTAVMP